MPLCRRLGRSYLPQLLLLLACIASCGGECVTCQVIADWDWPVSSPSAQGLDEDRLSDLGSALAAGELGPVSSMLIVRNGHLVFERYFRGQKQGDLHMLYSVTKSVTSALVGIATEEGFIGGMEAPLLGFFPEYTDLENDHAWKQAITLRHALQMRTGIEWEELSTNYSSPQNPVYHLYRSDDWCRFVLDRPMAAEPGTVFAYNTGVSTLLSSVIQRVVGVSAEIYAREKLFIPMGIDQYSWVAGPGGVTDTGGGLSLRPRDMARFGLLYLHGGIWQPTGAVLVPESWIEDSSEPHTEFTSGGGYGYQWWISATQVGENQARYPFAAGWGGQRIYVIPSLNMVIVLTAEGYAGEEISNGRILNEYVFAAVGP